MDCLNVTAHVHVLYMYVVDEGCMNCSPCGDLPTLPSSNRDILDRHNIQKIQDT